MDADLPQDPLNVGAEVRRLDYSHNASSQCRVYVVVDLRVNVLSVYRQQLEEKQDKFNKFMSRRYVTTAWKFK